MEGEPQPGEATPMSPQEQQVILERKKLIDVFPNFWNYVRQKVSPHTTLFGYLKKFIYRTPDISY